MSQDPYGNFSPFAAPNFIGGGSDPFLLSAQASASYGLQYQPIAGNQMGRNLGFDIPGMGPMGQVGSMLMSQMMASNGYTFTSVFGGANSQVMRNRYEMQQMQLASMTAMQRAGSSIMQQRMTSMGVNLALQSGANQADANAYGQQWGSMANSMLNNPMAMTAMNVAGAAFGVDVIGTVAPEAGIAQGLYRAGLTSYQGGGVFGLSAENVATMTGRVADYFYPGGSGDPTRLRGFNGRQVGDIAVALQQQGVMGSYRTDSTQFTGSDREIYRTELEKTGDRSQAVAAVNADALKGKLKDATRIFQIAKEITGSSDVNEMMQAIQTLTGGGMSTMSSSALEGQLSRIQEIARVARLSMDQMAFIAQQGSKMAESVGLSGTVGANAAVSMVERATITYAAANRSGGGEASPYNVTFAQQMDQDAQQMQAAMGSPMVQRLGAFSGILEQAERLQPGVVSKRIEELRTRKASGGKLSAREESTLAMLDVVQRIQTRKDTPEDAAAVRGEQGVTDLGNAAADLTGLSPGDARFRVASSRVDAELGLRAHPEYVEFVAGRANALDYQNKLSAALQGSDEINGIKNLTDDQRRQLIDSVSDLTINNRTGGARARERAAAIQKQFGLSSQDMLTAQLAAMGKLEYISGRNLVSIAALQSRGEGRAHLEEHYKALEEGMASNQALRDLGGTDFLSRLFDVAGNKLNVAEALGGIKDEALRKALSDPLERLDSARFKLNRSTTKSEWDAAAKQKAAAEAKFKELEEKLSTKASGIEGLSATQRKALQEERDKAQDAYHDASQFLVNHEVVSEDEMQELNRRYQKADQDLLGLLRNDRSTIGKPKDVTDVQPMQGQAAGAGGVASAKPARMEVGGKIDLMLAGSVFARGTLELHENNLPTAVQPSPVQNT